MNEKIEADYSALDRPDVCMFLFHPRPEIGFPPLSDTIDIDIEVEPGITVAARFHPHRKTALNLLFFHGNGEIVADYNQMGTIYHQMGVNFLPVDYRGYGKSGGVPTVTTMMGDCHKIFRFVEKWLPDQGYTGPLMVMGRSLGSASALELASHYQDRICGLIIESGFAYAEPLLMLLGVGVHSIGFREENGFRNIDKIRSFKKPTLIIHAEYDQIIRYSEGQALYEACESSQKTLVKIANADHNSIFFHGMNEYMASIQRLVDVINEKSIT